MFTLLCIHIQALVQQSTLLQSIEVFLTCSNDKAGETNECLMVNCYDFGQKDKSVLIWSTVSEKSICFNLWSGLLVIKTFGDFWKTEVNVRPSYILCNLLVCSNLEPKINLNIRPLPNMQYFIFDWSSCHDLTLCFCAVTEPHSRIITYNKNPIHFILTLWTWMFITIITTTSRGMKMFCYF
jgi:hypothetical protein